LIQKEIILASSSPRRKKLLQDLGIPFISVDPNIDEEMILTKIARDNNIEEKAMLISRSKAETVSKQYPGRLILAADTLVVVENNILGKPISIKEAIQFLKRLSNKSHSVITGFTLLFNEVVFSDFDRTNVVVRSLSEEEINNYCLNEQVLEAAGGYKIQSFYPDYVTAFYGSYHNVVGLPVAKVYEMIWHFFTKN